MNNEGQYNTVLSFFLTESNKSPMETRKILSGVLGKERICQDLTLT